MSKTKNILLIIASVFLLFALADGLPYGYFMLLRLIVCGVSVFTALYAYEIDKTWGCWVFGFIALLFNPLIPVHLTREIWVVIDVITALTMLIAIPTIRQKTTK